MGDNLIKQSSSKCCASKERKVKCDCAAGKKCSSTVIQQPTSPSFALVRSLLMNKCCNTETAEILTAKVRSDSLITDADAEVLVKSLMRAEHASKVLQRALEHSRGINEGLLDYVTRVEGEIVHIKRKFELLSVSLIESYDILVALLESELGLLLASCKAIGIGDDDREVSGQEEDTCSEQSLPPSRPQKDFLEIALKNRATAREAALGLCGTSTSSSNALEPLVRSRIVSMKKSLRDLNEDIKEGLPFLDLEDFCQEPLSSNPTSHSRDLEFAVLVQELLETREENARLRKLLLDPK